MILKDATGRDDDIRELERIAAAHPRVRTKAEAEIRRIRTGASGEESAAHFLDRTYKDSNRLAVLHDVRLDCGGGDYAQIDHLLIHRIQGVAWILETKNYSGDLSCDEHGDWVVFYNRRPTPVPSPVEQARRQAVGLGRWFKDHGVKGVSRIVPVVLTNPRARIDRRHLRADDHVVKSDNFVRWHEDQCAAIGAAMAVGMLGRFFVNGMDSEQLRALGAKITAAHEPAAFDWADRLGVKVPDDQTGAPIAAQPASAPSTSRALRSKITQAAAGMAAEALARAPAVAAAVMAKANPPSATKSEIRTRLGVIRTQPLDDGRIALRHDKDQALSDALQAACRGRAQWNPRYRNWIVKAADLPAVLATIG